MSLQIAPPYLVFTDKNGDPLDSGFVYVGVANQNPETNPVQVYYDTALTQPAAQPLRTSSGYIMRNGSPALIYANASGGFSTTVRDKSGSLIIYSPVGFGIPPETGLISVADFGAVGDGVTDDTAAFQAAALEAGPGNPIYVPSGRYLKSTIVNENSYFWTCGNALNPAGSGPISLLGHVEQAINNRRLISKTASSPNEFAEVQLSKNFSYNGGTPGYVSSNLRLDTNVSQNVSDFVWGITSVLNNSSNAGENVSIYGQGNRDAGTGPIWGGVFEAKDKTNTSGVGKSGTVGIEVDVFANGVVAGSLNRVGIDVVAGKGDPAGATCQAGYGVRVNVQGGSVANATYLIGYSAFGSTTADFSSASAATGAGFDVVGSPANGLRVSGTCVVGLNTSGGTITSNAVRLASGQNIAMEATGAIRTSWGITAAIWGFYNGATERFGINTSTGILRVNGTQVIDSRQTGWTAPTGTSARTTFDTATVTTAQLAERVKALIDDLTTHGLIGA
jgi:hypothetical protein